MKIQIFALLLLLASCKEKTSLTVRNLRCEYKVNPIGVDIRKPRFSWELESMNRGVKQTAYQIIVSSDKKKLLNGISDIWDSKKISSDQSIQVYYGGNLLKSNHKYYWKVNVWDQKGKLHSSEPAFWTSGLFNPGDWKAKWIGLDKAVGDDRPDKPHRELTARMLRHEFKVKKKIQSATAFISGLGLFELYINGQKIGDQVLAPALTEYNKRAFYMTFDVTQNLKADGNVIGVILGNGRYFAPRTNEPTLTRTYGFPKVICQIEIQYEDGTGDTVITDESWKLTTRGPICKNNEYDGEYYDARMEQEGWNKLNFDDSDWINAKLVRKPGDKLVAQPNEPIKIMEEINPVTVKEIEPGVFIFDMGQNMVGWVELFVKVKRGDKVKLRFAETLKDDGSLFMDNLRGAEVTDTYILKGEGDESWEPRFTYHGFRFVEMTGYPGVPALSSIKGKVVYDALEITGSFTCSNPLINNIYKNAFWGIRGNYRSMPTDCPQRDERQGWLGDRSAECTGESFIFDISKLYNKWVTDMKDAQQESGSLPDVAPSYWPNYTDNTTWPGTYLFATEMLYNQYGDLKTVEANYPYMQKWINYMSRFLKNGIMPKDTYGDWCVPPEDLKLIHTNDPLKTTSAEYIGTAYFFTELKLMAKFAQLLGKENDAEKYMKLAGEMKIAFNNRFLDKKNIRYSNNSVTVNILALAFDLVPDQYRDNIMDNLLQKILGENNMHVGSGIVGGQWLMRTLTENGHADVAYALADQSTYPSWGYMVIQGATTIWELWNGDHGDPGMNSGNHVMLLGDLIIWFYEDLAGIKADPEQPAFKHTLMKPQVLGDLKFVKAAYHSIHGRIKSEWHLEEGKFRWNVSVPANTRATIWVPTLEREEVMEGKKRAVRSPFVKFIRWEDMYAVFEIESGNYSFSSKGVKKKLTKPYVATPVITPGDTTVMKGNRFMVTLKCRDEKAEIKYTLDGSVPGDSSHVYRGPFEVSDITLISARAFKEGYNPSVQLNAHYDFVDPDKNGIRWKLCRGAFRRLPDFKKMKPDAVGKVYQFGLDKIKVPEQNFALQFDAFIQIDKQGRYTFYISSNDGSKLYIDGRLLIDNDGEHGPKQLGGSVHLSPGKHAIRAEYFQSGGSKTLQVAYNSETISYQPVPGSALFLTKD